MTDKLYKAIQCAKCGRDTIDGDCYGCVVDRLLGFIRRILTITKDPKTLKEISDFMNDEQCS